MTTDDEQPDGFGGPLAGPPAELSAPEFAVLVSEPKVVASTVTRAALVESIARGAVRLERVPVRKLGFTRDVHVLNLADGPVDDVAPVLAPVLEAIRTAPRTRTTDGRDGVTIPAWAQRFSKLTGSQGYATTVVRPALVERGLLTARKRTLRAGYSYTLSPNGAQLARWARDSAAQLRKQADKRARKSWNSDPQTAAATLAALGGLGTLALSDPLLVSALVELRHLSTGSADWAPAAATGGFDSGLAGLDASGHGLQDLDAAALSSFDSGLSTLDGGGIFDGGASDDSGGHHGGGSD